jgi:hypothetical protein
MVKIAPATQALLQRSSSWKCEVLIMGLYAFLND